MTEPEQRLIDVAILMSQELQELIGDAIEASDDPNAMKVTQDLLEDWHNAYQASGLGWQDHFKKEKAEADNGFVEI